MNSQLLKLIPILVAGLAVPVLAESNETARLIQAEIKAHRPFNVPGIGLEMRPIPSGSFLMGSPPDEPGRDTEGLVEEPQTQVTISKPFWLGRNVVTVGQWRALKRTT